MGAVEASPIPLHGRRWSLNLTLPPLSAVFLLSPEPEADLLPISQAPESAELDDDDAGRIDR